MRKTVGKIAAISVCLGLLFIAVPNANAVDKKPTRLEFLKKSAKLFDSIVPFFTSIFDSGKKSPEETTTVVKKVKTAGTLPSHRLSDGD